MSLQINDLIFSYNKRDLFNGISDSLLPGTVHFLAGPNGSGKSTLLKLLCGCLPAQSGSVKLSGRDLKSLSHTARARQLGVVWQSIADDLDFTVRELVTILAGARFTRLGRLSNQDALLIEEALEKFGLGKIARQSFNTLSGGERQRTALAGAWALAPQILLLDEPTSALDPAWRNRVMDLLDDYALTHTVLMVTHDLELLGRAHGRVWLLDNAGNFIAGNAGEVLTEGILTQVYSSPARVEITPGGRRRIYFD